MVGAWFVLPRWIGGAPSLPGPHVAARRSGGGPVASHTIAFASDVARPNFLIVIGDDYGQDQVGAYKVHPRPPPSPRIDALAAQGVMFRNATSNPVCSPTRATVLTGRYAWRYGIGSAIPPKPGWGLPATERLLPRALDEGTDNAYASAMIGKWHLATPDMGGVDHVRTTGFDHHFGTMGNLLGNVYGTEEPMTYYHWSKVEDGVAIESHDYITQVTINDAIRFSRELPEPWLMVVSFHLTHFPQHVPPAGLFTQDVPANPSETDLYRLMAESMDTEFGRLLDSVDPTVLSHTEILFMGDNGTAPVGVVAPWEKSSSKGELTRGGVAVPFIWAGPSVQNPGSESVAMVNTSDVFATVLDLAHAGGPRPEDSVSFADVLADPSVPGQRKYAYAEHFSPNGMGPYTERQSSVRDDRWALVVVDGKPDQLYDRSTDPLERNNLLKIPKPSDEQLAAFKRLKYAMPDKIPVDQRPTREALEAAGIDTSGKL